MLHSRDARRDDLDDDLFASTDLAISVPKYRIPERENDPRHAYQIVADELMLDGNSRQNLATFCQTWLGRLRQARRKSRSSESLAMPCHIP